MGKVTSKLRYPLASASQRFFARLFDMIIIILISVAIGFLCFIGVDTTATTDAGFTNFFDWLASLFDSSNSSDTPATDPFIIDGWRIFLIFLLSTITNIIYFVVIPYFWKGFTICKYLFKIHTYELINRKYFFKHLVKREMFIWGLSSIINMILAIFCWSSDNAWLLLNDLINMNPPHDPQVEFIASSVFKTLYAITGLVLLALIVHMFFNNKKRAFHDLASDTCVISTVATPSDDPQGVANKFKNKVRNYSLPGEINPGAFDELDDLDDLEIKIRKDDDKHEPI